MIDIWMALTTINLFWVTFLDNFPVDLYRNVSVYQWYQALVYFSDFDRRMISSPGVSDKNYSLSMHMYVGIHGHQFSITLGSYWFGFIINTAFDNLICNQLIAKPGILKLKNMLQWRARNIHFSTRFWSIYSWRRERFLMTWTVCSWDDNKRKLRQTKFQDTARKRGPYRMESTTDCGLQECSCLQYDNVLEERTRLLCYHSQAQAWLHVRKEIITILSFSVINSVPVSRDKILVLYLIQSFCSSRCFAENSRDFKWFRDKIFDAVVLKRLPSKVTLFVRSFCLQAILVLILKLSSLYNRINSKRQITRRCDDGKSMADQQWQFKLNSNSKKNLIFFLPWRWCMHLLKHVEKFRN